MFKCEITTQAATKLGEIKKDLNSQIFEAVSTASSEEVLFSNPNTLGTQGTGLKEKSDLRSLSYTGAFEAVNRRQTRDNEVKS